MNINCIAIDDEPLALDIIKDYCSKVTFLNLLRTFDNAIESIEFIRSNKVDLIFLDIQMEELTGIQLLNALKHRPFVIFTTAYERYAIQGFELDVVDYLLKPIDVEGVRNAIKKLNSLSGSKENNQDFQKLIDSFKKNSGYKTHFLIPVKGDVFFQ